MFYLFSFFFFIFLSLLTLPIVTSIVPALSYQRSPISALLSALSYQRSPISALLPALSASVTESLFQLRMRILVYAAYRDLNPSLQLYLIHTYIHLCWKIITGSARGR
jgi:hypothetical protein